MYPLQPSGHGLHVPGNHMRTMLGPVQSLIALDIRNALTVSPVGLCAQYFDESQKVLAERAAAAAATTPAPAQLTPATPGASTPATHGGAAPPPSAQTSAMAT